MISEKEVREQLGDKFWENITINGNGCWQWLGTKQISKDGTRPFSGREIFYKTFIGVIPDGFRVKEKCYNRGCVNPEHLICLLPGAPRTNLKLQRKKNHRSRKYSEPAKIAKKYYLSTAPWCNFCKDIDNLTIDHIIPIVATKNEPRIIAWINADNNFQLLCNYCSEFKSKFEGKCFNDKEFVSEILLYCYEEQKRGLKYGHQP